MMEICVCYGSPLRVSFINNLNNNGAPQSRISNMKSVPQQGQDIEFRSLTFNSVLNTKRIRHIS
jgi:hypothetical protein